MANKTIHELTDLGSSLASDYELAIYNTSSGANTTGKGSILNLLGTSITGLDTTASTLPGAINELDGEIENINDLIGSTSISSIGDGTLTGAISNLNSKTVSTSQIITNFYNNRCENITEGEETFIMKFGSINIVVICVKMKIAVTSNQTTIFTLPSGYNSPLNYQSYGVVRNSTTGKMYQAQVSSTGNVNIINRGELAVDDYLYGQIVWMA